MRISDRRMLKQKYDKLNQDPRFQLDVVEDFLNFNHGKDRCRRVFRFCGPNRILTVSDHNEALSGYLGWDGKWYDIPPGYVAKASRSPGLFAKGRREFGKALAEQLDALPPFPTHFTGRGWTDKLAKACVDHQAFWLSLRGMS